MRDELSSLVAAQDKARLVRVRAREVPRPSILHPAPRRSSRPLAFTRIHLRSQRLSAIEAMLLNLGQRIDAK